MASFWPCFYEAEVNESDRSNVIQPQANDFAFLNVLTGFISHI